MSAPDLSQAIAFRSAALNTVTLSNVDGVATKIGCTVESFDLGEVELVQFMEKNALADGMDVGSVWRGARHPVMRGAVHDKTRGECYDRIAALEAIMLPESGLFGFYDLTFSTITTASGTHTTKTISVRPNGLRYEIVRDTHGQKIAGRDDTPLSIAWSVSFYAKNPAVS